MRLTCDIWREAKLGLPRSPRKVMHRWWRGGPRIIGLLYVDVVFLFVWFGCLFCVAVYIFFPILLPLLWVFLFVYIFLLLLPLLCFFLFFFFFFDGFSLLFFLFLFLFFCGVYLSSSSADLIFFLLLL